MVINNTTFAVDLGDILGELKAQLRANNIDLLQDIKPGFENYMVTCPYHKNGQERKPSAGIDTHTGTFHCFTCQEVHSLPEVISHCFGKNDMLGKFGWEWLLKNFLTVSVEDRKSVELDLTRNRHKVQSDNFVSDEELDSYRYIHPYMYERRLTDEVIDIFDIGYDRETECLTFPVRDMYGKTLFVARRSVKTKYFNYPRGVEKPLYGLYEVLCAGQKSTELIVCESMLDALTCWVYGKYAVALNGLGSPLQFKQLREFPFRKLILATDNDKRGLEARKRIRENVPNKLITEFILPKGRKDINELSKEEFDNLEEVF